MAESAIGAMTIMPARLRPMIRASLKLMREKNMAGSVEMQLQQGCYIYQDHVSRVLRKTRPASARRVARPASSIVALLREFDLVLLLAGVEFHDLARHAGQHGRDRVDVQDRRAGRTDHLIGHGEQTLVAAVAEEQA